MIGAKKGVAGWQSLLMQCQDVSKQVGGVYCAFKTALWGKCITSYVHSMGGLSALMVGKVIQQWTDMQRKARDIPDYQSAATPRR